MLALKIFLLGSFQVMLAEQPLERFDTNKTRALLAYLAMENLTPQRRDLLAGLLWPEYPNAAALRNLRLTLFRLRQTFEQAAAGTPLPDPTFPVTLDRQTVQFSRQAAAWVDVQEFETLISRARHHLHTSLTDCPSCISSLIQAVSLYRGDFLEGFTLKDSFGFEEWVLLRRERLRQQMLEVLDQLSFHFLRRAEYAASPEERQQALEQTRAYSRRAIKMEPWREIAHQQLMRAMALAGYPQEALAQYRLCRQILADEFGIEPDPATVKLYQQIRGKALDTRPLGAGIAVGKAMVDGKIAAAPAVRPAHNLPPQLTPLIGREAQLSRLAHLLASYRWVTLVGEGGIGKTRLALEAAEKALEHYPDGVWLTPLAEVELVPAEETDPQAVRELLAKAIATACQAPLTEGLPADQQLIEHLRARKVLLILDSFEHLAAGATLITDVLISALDVHVLVTTRHVLYFQAGYMMRVEGLPAPERLDDPLGAQYASVRLLAERIERLSGNFRLDEKNLPGVMRICQLLDGVPLALELAAPWATRLTLDEVAHAIRTDLDFLSSAMSGLPERHRSLRAVLESAWRQLNPHEQQILAQCARLAGPFDYEQAQAVSQASPRDLEALVDKSLVVRLAPGRYHIHETLRHFTTEKNVK